MSDISLVKRPLIGVAVIVHKQGRILLGERRNAHGHGTWALPGGHLEFSETIEACARREVYEETDLQINNIRKAAFTNDFFEESQKHYVTLYVTAQYDSGVLILKEPEKCAQWEWFACDRLPAPKFLSLRHLLQEFPNLSDLIDPWRW